MLIACLPYSREGAPVRVLDYINLNPKALLFTAQLKQIKSSWTPPSNEQNLSCSQLQVYKPVKAVVCGNVLVR